LAFLFCGLFSNPLHFNQDHENFKGNTEQKHEVLISFLSFARPWAHPVLICLTEPISPLWFTQPVDHFAATTKFPDWQQMYYVNDTYWSGNGAPILCSKPALFLVPFRVEL
jgi:hypothetical protein